MASILLHKELDAAIEAALEPLIRTYGEAMVYEAMRESGRKCEFSLDELEELKEQAQIIHEGTVNVVCPECDYEFEVLQKDGSWTD